MLNLFNGVRFIVRQKIESPIKTDVAAMSDEIACGLFRLAERFCLRLYEVFVAGVWLYALCIYWGFFYKRLQSSINEEWGSLFLPRGEEVTVSVLKSIGEPSEIADVSEIYIWS